MVNNAARIGSSEGERLIDKIKQSKTTAVMIKRSGDVQMRRQKQNEETAHHELT